MRVLRSVTEIFAACLLMLLPMCMCFKHNAKQVGSLGFIHGLPSILRSPVLQQRSTCSSRHGKRMHQIPVFQGAVVLDSSMENGCDPPKKKSCNIDAGLYDMLGKRDHEHLIRTACHTMYIILKADWIRRFSCAPFFRFFFWTWHTHEFQKHFLQDT
jgi:hypothetical protein